MAKKLAAILLCVVLIFVGVLALGHLTRPLGDDVAIANVENFHKLPENSIDVIVYGSSHAWRNVNADEMYDKYGIGAYNYAANWQHLDTTWQPFSCRAATMSSISSRERSPMTQFSISVQSLTSATNTPSRG